MLEKILKCTNAIIAYGSSLKNEMKLKKTENNDNIHLIAKRTLTINESDGKEFSDTNKANEFIGAKCISLKSPWESTGLIVDENSNDQQTIYKLLRGNYEKIHSLVFNVHYFKSLIIKKNPDFFLEGKEVIKNLLKDLHECLNSSEFNEYEILHFKIIIGELLSLYPYLRTNLKSEKDSLSVPILINDRWEFVKYNVEEIPFIPEKMPKAFLPLLGSPIVAYGLTPEDQKHKTTAPPLLLFKGTTFPTDKGFSLSLIADFFPFKSVGSFAFWLGQDVIKNWLIRTTTHQKALVFGKSLGGSLAFKTALTFHKLISVAKKYGGPGCSKKELRKLQELSKQEDCPQFDRIIQKNDPVPDVDWIPIAKNVNHYIITSEKERSGFWAHADIYSTHESASIYLSEPSEEDQYDWKRYKMTLLRDVGSCIFFPILITLHLVFSVALVGLYRFFQKNDDQSDSVKDSY